MCIIVHYNGWFVDQNFQIFQIFEDFVNCGDLIPNSLVPTIISTTIDSQFSHGNLPLHGSVGLEFSAPSTPMIYLIISPHHHTKTRWSNILLLFLPSLWIFSQSTRTNLFVQRKYNGSVCALD